MCRFAFCDSNITLAYILNSIVEQLADSRDSHHLVYLLLNVE